MEFLEKYDIVNIFDKAVKRYLEKQSMTLTKMYIENINNIYHLKYSYEKLNRQHLTTTILTSSKYDELLGYFEEVENGFIFISCDNSHNWKRFRTFLTEYDNIIIIGEHLLILDNKDIELEKRYFFKNDNSSFYFKSKVAKISDMYVQSKVSERYFIFRDNFYASSDYTSNSYLSDKLFENVEMTNDHLIMLMSVSNHKSIEEIERIYREKVYKKLLKV